MWLKGQPVYYAQISGGGGYEKGKEMAASKADYITLPGGAARERSAERPAAAAEGLLLAAIGPLARWCL
jgi:hypothetical protein